jgi:hypothetical protein
MAGADSVAAYHGGAGESAASPARADATIDDELLDLPRQP